MFPKEAKAEQRAALFAAVFVLDFIHFEEVFCSMYAYLCLVREHVSDKRDHRYQYKVVVREPRVMFEYVSGVPG